MRAFILLTTSLLAIGALAHPSQAQGPNWIVDAAHKDKPPVSDMPIGPKAYVGAWVVGKDGEGADVCTVRFNAAGVIGGFQLVAPKSCKGAVAHWDDLYAWRVQPNGDIVMADATRRAVYVFKKLDDEVWATEGADWDRLLLRRAPASRAKR